MHHSASANSCVPTNAVPSPMAHSIGIDETLAAAPLRTEVSPLASAGGYLHRIRKLVLKTARTRSAP